MTSKFRCKILPVWYPTCRSGMARVAIVALVICLVGQSPLALRVAAQERSTTWHALPMTPNGDWEVCHFGGDGLVKFSDAQAVLELGDPLTGIRSSVTFPVTQYELEFEAQRLDGFDFFVGLTFPVGDAHCSLILGGWSGTVIGLSSMDDRDASDNPSTAEGDFDNDRWYKVRVRVTDETISAWVDRKRWVHQKRAGVRWSVRQEMDLTRPLGIAAYQCKVAYRNFRYRKLLH